MSDVVAKSIDLSHKHPLVFKEDIVENDGNKEAVCSRCEKPVLQGPGYKCSECNFLLHKSCYEPPTEIHHHPLHPNHTLFLRSPSKGNKCDACREICSRRLFYRCGRCDFDLDINCVSRWRNSIDECHQHEFFPIFPGLNQIQFICEACGEESKDGAIAYLCSRCRFLVHRKCAEYPRTISTSVHKHSLTLTCSLHQMVLEEIKDDISCQVCCRKVKTKYGVYYCQDCRYAAHLQCAGRYEGEYMDVESVPSEIEHFSLHEHKLMMSKKEVEEEDDRICEGCMLSISDPTFYSCQPCNYFLHATCSILPSKKQLPLLHQHPLNLLSQPPNSPSGIFRCVACYRLQHGFCYSCDLGYCNFKMDTQCSSLPETLNHEGHQHSLRIALNRDRIICHGCYDEDRPDCLFVCTECEFGLCYRCATLPYRVRYDYDIHDFLTLTYSVEDDSGEYYCFICEEIRDTRKWFYYCKKCDFAAHPHCVIGKYSRIKFGRTFTSHEYHEHPLTIVKKNEYSPPCDSCGSTFDGLAVACTQCKFSFHVRGLGWGEKICRKR